MSEMNQARCSVCGAPRRPSVKDCPCLLGLMPDFSPVSPAELDTEGLRHSYWEAWQQAKVDPLFGWMEDWHRQHPGHPGFDVDEEARTITPWPNHRPPAEPAPHGANAPESEFRDWLKQQRDTTVPSDKFDPAYERGRADGLQVAIDEATRRAGSVPLDAEPAPLDTGRWEQQGQTYALRIQDDDRGTKRWARLWCYLEGHPAMGRVCTDDGGYAEVSAGDLEAAARIIRHHQEPVVRMVQCSSCRRDYPVVGSARGRCECHHQEGGA